jgi:hypothetical protein
MSRDRDTIEDVLAYACAVDAISESTFDRLAAELNALRAAASPLAGPRLREIVAERHFQTPVVPELLFYDCHDPTKWPAFGSFRPLIHEGAPGDALRFNDERSRAQIAAYLAHRMPACEERNEAARKRWGDHQRDAWQLHHLGAARVRSIKEIP